MENDGINDRRYIIVDVGYIITQRYINGSHHYAISCYTPLTEPEHLTVAVWASVQTCRW